MKKALLGLAAFAAGLISHFAQAETTECTQITSVPTTISVQGVYCFKSNLVTGITTGNAITIATNNVTIDMNGFKLGGSAAGAGTNANGVYAVGRKNFTLRNGTIKGFLRGVYLSGTTSARHILEDLKIEGNTHAGIELQGSDHVIRNNQILNTGSGSNTISAVGIDLDTVSRSQVTGNLISSVAEINQAWGIHVESSSLVEISENSIFEIAASSFAGGIYVAFGNDEVLIMNNKVINQTTVGSYGLYSQSTATNTSCVENFISGFAGAQFGCDFLSGNLTP